MNPRRDETVRLAHPAGGVLPLYLSYATKPLDAAIVYVHGFSSHRRGEKSAALEAACASRGWTFASFDFRGHGEATGAIHELSGSGLLADMDLVADSLAKQGIGRLCLVGSSMGGWVSAWFALRNPEKVIACAMIAPAFDFINAYWDQLPEAARVAWQRTGRLRVRNQWIDAELGYALALEWGQFPRDRLAAGLAGPMLIFHGMQDDVVPYTGSIDLVRQAGSARMELRLYKDGDHRLLALKHEMAEAACAFFGSCLSIDRVSPRP